MIVKFFLPIFYDFFRKSLQNKGFRYENFSDFGTFRYGFMENLRFGWKKIVPNATIGYVWPLKRLVFGKENLKGD